MNNLYSNEMIDKLNIEKRRATLFIFIPLIVVIPVYVILLFNANLDNKVLFSIIATLLFLIFSYNLIFQIDIHIKKPNDLLKHINSVYKKMETEEVGIVEKINEITTLNRNIHIKEIELKKEDEYRRLYFNIDLNNVEFNEKDNVKFMVVNNFIVGYEVIQ